MSPPLQVRPAAIAWHHHRALCVLQLTLPPAHTCLPVTNGAGRDPPARHVAWFSRRAFHRDDVESLYNSLRLLALRAEESVPQVTLTKQRTIVESMPDIVGVLPPPIDRELHKGDDKAIRELAVRATTYAAVLCTREAGDVTPLASAQSVMNLGLAGVFVAACGIQSGNGTRLGEALSLGLEGVEVRTRVDVCGCCDVWLCGCVAVWL